MGDLMTLPPDRRKHVRIAGHHVTPVHGLRLRTGQQVRVLDLSREGASVETDARLAPGSPLQVVVTRGESSLPAASTVVSARVIQIHPTLGARYRIGLRIHGDVLCSSPSGL
jgi:hypothetical protein